MSIGKLQNMGGNFVSRLGGADILKQEELSKLTPEQIVQYNQQREAAKNIGMRELAARLSDAFAGRDVVGRAAQRKALGQTKMQKPPVSYQEYLLTDNTPTPEEYSSFLTKSSSPGSLLQVIDSGGNFVKNISKKDALASTEDLAKQGYRITNIPTGTEAAPSADMSLEKRLQPIVDQYKTGTNLINEVSTLAKNVAENPETANKLVAGGANAIEFLKSNIKGFANIAEKNKDNPIYKQLKVSQTSLEGTDFSDKIAEVSGGSAIIQSQILDLAFTFAAARGQSGRGLSDRDFQNALDIISKGVNAEQKIAVMQDISRRITNEYNTTVDIARRLNSGDKEFIEKLEEFKNLSPFVNPYTNAQTQTSTNIEDILKKYPPQG
jgi:hypothetical protein